MSVGPFGRSSPWPFPNKLFVVLPFGAGEAEAFGSAPFALLGCFAFFAPAEGVTAGCCASISQNPSTTKMFKKITSFFTYLLLLPDWLRLGLDGLSIVDQHMDITFQDSLARIVGKLH